MDEHDAASPRHRARAALDMPVLNPVLNAKVGEGTLDYEIYVNTSRLLSLQPPVDELVCPDELMFQITHQAQELWLKLLAHELAELIGDFDEGDLWSAATRLDRGIRVVHCLSREIRVLETLTPDSYQVIRRHLGNGSGQESPGYNRVRVVAAYVCESLLRLLSKRGVSLVDIYDGTGVGHPDLKRVCELLVDLDEGYQSWLFVHFMLVRRTLGVQRGVTALDGVPTQVLTGRMTQPLFRPLWKVRGQLTARWDRSGGTAPTDDRRSHRRAS